MEAKEALFYTPKNNKAVSCFLCNHHCFLENNALGKCTVRKNINGVLRSLNYAKVIAANIDPIEKKPLYHFLPKTETYSIASVGCNFHCDFCQNWQISQANIDSQGESMSPEDIVSEAIANDCKSISYTYTEPTIFFEFAYECAKLAKAKGLKNIFVTNGYMSKQALEYIQPYLSAVNVDLKSFRDRFYQNYCQGRLAPVLETIKLIFKLKIWLELTTLIIPERNDSKEELTELASFIAAIDKNIPWHISRCHPAYKATDISPTPLTTLEEAYVIGKEQGLNYVYIGNVPK